MNFMCRIYSAISILLGILSLLEIPELIDLSPKILFVIEVKINFIISKFQVLKVTNTIIIYRFEVFANVLPSFIPLKQLISRFI